MSKTLSLLFAALVGHFSQQYVSSAEKIMVATGGDGTNLLSNIEVFDISSKPKTCKNLRSFPINVLAAEGALGVNDLPTICGGFVSAGSAIKSCYAFENGDWKTMSSLKTERSNFAMNQFTLDNINKQLYVSGGHSVPPNDTNLTEFLTPGGGSWENHIPLPLKTFEHCMVNIENKILAVIGGLTIPPSEGNTYYFTDGSTQWTLGPKLNDPRFGHKCALIKKNDVSTDRSVIVVGGVSVSSKVPVSSVEVYNMDKNVWERGADFPFPVVSGSLTTDELGGVVYIGGMMNNPGTLSSFIYRLAHTGAAAKWELHPQILKTPRYKHVAISIKDKITDCS